MSKDEIKEMIDKQKRELNEFIDKFSDLDNFINKYKEEVLEIKKVKASIASSEQRLSDIEKQLLDLQNSSKNL